MKTLASLKRIPVLARISASLALLGCAAAIGVVVAGTGCDGGTGGARCNPSNSHNDCNDGLVCTQPDFCVENYCCPANVTPSDNPYCQPGCAGGAQTLCSDYMAGTGPLPPSNLPKTSAGVQYQATDYCNFTMCEAEGGTAQACDMAFLPSAMSQDAGAEGGVGEGAAEGSPEASGDAPAEGGSPASDASDAGTDGGSASEPAPEAAPGDASDGGSG